MDDTLLPADPLRGITPTALEAAETDFDGLSYGYGMHTAAGAARLSQALDAVSAALRAGLGRDVALAVWHGAAVRLERDGHGEYSDTVVRESIVAALELDFADVGVAPVTDDEVNEVAMLLSLRTLRAATSTLRKALSART